jgi:hypothetical protein
MTLKSALIFLLLAAAPATAQTVAEDDTALVQPAGEAQLADFLWLKRPLIVFADSPNDPRFVQQMEYIAALPDELTSRDVVVLTDTDPAAMSPLRTQLRPQGFMLVLAGKDGTLYLRKPFPWTVREIGRSIDKLPIRQQELRDHRLGGN